MKLLIILIGSLCACSSQAQEINIGDWQNQHPEILFIEHDVYYSFDEETLNRLSDDVIIYNTSAQAEDIKFYLEKKALSLNSNVLFDYSDPNAEFIKQWLGENKDVAIIRSQEFNDLTSVEQNSFLENGGLVLIEEYLTLDKISEYEASL